MSEGHTEGNLNIVATRRGWSRNFTLAADAVTTMDYTTLSSLLELDSLNLRTTRLRIYVEHPVNSGSFALLRGWTSDDGSLQSALVRAFFAERLENNQTVVLDIRDDEPVVAHDRTNVRAREWLRALPRATRTHSVYSSSNVADTSIAEQSPPIPEVEGQTHHESSASQPAQANSGSFFGLFRTSMVGGPPAPPPKDDPSPHASAPPSPPPSDPEAEMKKEEEVLRERGWKPVLRRLTTRRKTTKKDVEASAATQATGQEQQDITDEGDGEPVEAPDPQEMSAEALATPEKPIGLFSRVGNSTFLNRKKSKKEVKTKAKAPEPIPAADADTQAAEPAQNDESAPPAVEEQQQGVAATA